MTIFEIYQNAISLHNYKLDEMENKIEEMYAMGRINSEEHLALIKMAEENSVDLNTEDVIAKLADLEARIVRLETADIPVWVAGYITKKGETVKYDYNGDGILDLLRYDGGRATTSLSPGKIDGWHVVDSTGKILGTWYNGEFTPVNEGENNE